MRRRVRWENVIRMAVVASLVAMVVAWPLLAPPEPRLPGAAATPLVERDDEPQVPGGDETRGGEGRPRIGRGGDDGRAEPGEGDPRRVERRHEAQRRRRWADRRDEAERRERGRRAHRNDEAKRSERGRRRAERRGQAAARPGGAARQAERRERSGRRAPPPPSADPPEPVGTAVPSPPDDPAAAEFGFESGH